MFKYCGDGDLDISCPIGGFADIARFVSCKFVIAGGILFSERRSQIHGSSKNRKLYQRALEGEGAYTGTTGRTISGIKENNLKMGDRDFPKLKRPYTYSRLHYFQYKKPKIYWRYYYGSKLNLHPMQ